MSNKILLICNKQQQAYYEQVAALLKKEIILISQETDFNQFAQTEAIEDIYLCLLQAELTWSKRIESKLYGFEIAKQLRVAGLRCTIYFCTSLPATYFQDKKEKFPLLRVHTYHQILTFPLRKEQIQNLKGENLSNEQLEDVIDTLLDVPSLIREVMHNLKNRVSLKKGADNTALLLKQAVLTDFSELSLLLPDKQEELQAIQQKLLQQLYQEISKESHRSFQQIVDHVTDDIIALTPLSKSNKEPQFNPKTKWKVLFIDDDKNVQGLLIEGFNRNNIPCIPVSTGEAVFEILKKDEAKNDITVLLCDIRLKDAITGDWHKYQGYDIFQMVYREHPNYLRFFALTSAKKRLFRLKKNYQIQLVADYKNDVISSDGALNLFIQKIREAGDDMFFKVRSRPDLSSWTKKTRRFDKPLSWYYRAHLLSIDYEQHEAHINEMATIFVQNIIDNNTVENVTVEFTGTIKEMPHEETGLEKFRYRTLLGRRIAIALYYHWLNFSDKTEQVFHAMQPTAEVKDLKASMKLLFNTSFALSFKKDLPKKGDIDTGYYLRSKLLEEEVKWLVTTYPQLDFDVEKIRRNQSDLDTLLYILESTVDELSKTSVKNLLQETQKEQFIQQNFEKITTIKLAKKALQTAHSLAFAYGFGKKWKFWLEVELDYFQHTELIAFIKKEVLS